MILSFATVVTWLPNRKLPEGKGGGLGFFCSVHHLLEPQEEDLQPQPGKQQQDDHGGEGKAKPGGEVHHVAVLREEPEGGYGLLL